MIILKLLAFSLLAFAAYVAVQPDDFKISRTATIHAPAEAVFAQINDLQKWNSWSPWAKMDPDAKTAFEGPSAGVGAVMSWASAKNEVGEGSMKIMESRANEYVRFQLDFVKPMVASNTAEFSFQKDGESTAVTWSMSGKNNFIGKAMSVIFNCDKMVGSMFESGLTNLNSVLQAK